MKFANAKTFATAAGIILALVVSAPAQAADKGCSNATLKGTFGYTITGFGTAPLPMAGPFGSVGTQNFDGSGNTTATALASANGNPVPLTITGTYVVNLDCTGVLTITISPLSATPSHVYFVIDDGGQEIRAIGADPGGVLTYVGKRQFPAGDWRQ